LVKALAERGVMSCHCAVARVIEEESSHVLNSRTAQQSGIHKALKSDNEKVLADSGSKFRSSCKSFFGNEGTRSRQESNQSNFKRRKSSDPYSHIRAAATVRDAEDGVKKSENEIGLVALIRSVRGAAQSNAAKPRRTPNRLSGVSRLPQNIAA